MDPDAGALKRVLGLHGEVESKFHFLTCIFFSFIGFQDTFYYAIFQPYFIIFQSLFYNQNTKTQIPAMLRVQRFSFFAQLGLSLP